MSFVATTSIHKEYHGLAVLAKNEKIRKTKAWLVPANKMSATGNHLCAPLYRGNNIYSIANIN
ncbi:MAG: hypothetical protein JST75_12575 [Bacteroidetes bacterium]|nr:hypothetical protein [Bacteroidota bacterium]